MGRKSVLTLAALLALVARAPIAHAEKSEPGESPRHRVRLDLGVASALGFGGLAYAYSPREWFQLETGVGMSFSGPTLSLMPKYAFGSGSDHLVAGAGVALAHNWANCSGWLNADVGWEHLFSTGLLLSAAVGVTAGEHSHEIHPWEGRLRQVLPQFRFGVGYAFGGEEGGVSAPALAPDAAPPRSPTRKNRLGFDFGVLSAVGLTGITYSRQMAEAFALETGVGLGPSGVQLSLMPKLTIGSGANYYVAGVGAARAVGVSKTPMFWVNADVLGYERRMRNGWGFSIALGATACVSGKSTGFFAVDRGQVAPQLRIGGAYWL